MEKKDIIVLYDKNDVLEFNLIGKNCKKVFLFSPGLEIFLKNKDKLDIYKIDNELNYLIQKKIILESKKIYEEYKKNLNYLETLDKGIIENVHNIFNICVFSFMFLIENLKDFKSYKLIYKKEIHEFDDFDKFILVFLEKMFFKDNLVFFKYLQSTKISKVKTLFIKINNQICRLAKNNNTILVCGSLLSKKILENTKKKANIFQLKSYKDFNIKHLILNFLSLCNFFKKKNFFYLSPTPDNFLNKQDLKINLQKFFDSFQNRNFSYFKNIIANPIKKYCENQNNFRESVTNFVDFIKPKCVFVDQLRFDVSTLLASVCLKKKIDVILVPHGSISIPEQNDEFSSFVLPICARGLIFSNIASYSVAQSKISYQAIRNYDPNIKILKSKPILFGKNILHKNNIKKNNFIFLHASTPKSLSAWPWIYENYNEYIVNINDLITNLKNFKNVELIIRFREGPECDLETFKKLINIDQNKFVKISSNKNFFDDLDISDCLISFSSTSIEETLFCNKKVLIYSNNKSYKHINYKFDKNNDIVYAFRENINEKLKLIISNNKIFNYKVLWEEPISKNENLKEFICNYEI